VSRGSCYLFGHDDAGHGRPAGAHGPRRAALLGASLALALMRRAAIARWGLWAAFAVGVVLSAAGMRAASLRQPVLLLLIASSALGFRFGARR
jgi:hypothetical protein